METNHKSPSSTVSRWLFYEEGEKIPFCHLAILIFGLIYYYGKAYCYCLLLFLLLSLFRRAG